MHCFLRVPCNPSFNQDQRFVYAVTNYLIKTASLKHRLINFLIHTYLRLAVLTFINYIWHPIPDGIHHHVWRTFQEEKPILLFLNADRQAKEQLFPFYVFGKTPSPETKSGPPPRTRSGRSIYKLSRRCLRWELPHV